MIADMRSPCSSPLRLGRLPVIEQVLGSQGGVRKLPRQRDCPFKMVSLLSRLKAHDIVWDHDGFSPFEDELRPSRRYVLRVRVQPQKIYDLLLLQEKERHKYIHRRQKVRNYDGDTRTQAPSRSEV